MLSGCGWRWDGNGHLGQSMIMGVFCRGLLLDEFFQVDVRGKLSVLMIVLGVKVESWAGILLLCNLSWEKWFRGKENFI